MENRFRLDSDLELPEPEGVSGEYGEPMESCDKGVTSFSIPNWGSYKPFNDDPLISLKDDHNSYESILESKQSTDNFTERVFSIKSVPNCVAGRSLSNKTPEESKCELSTRKQEEVPHKFSLQSYDLEDKIVDRRSKQERNRESAKKCRQRKKEYIINLENELKTTKEELAVCKNELEILRGNILTNTEQEYNKLKEELLTQARSVIDNKTPTVKLDELVSTLSVI